MTIHIKRAYAPPDHHDGFRVLVDRYWPRGVNREHARLDAWVKEVAPSAELISWFGHKPERWEEFRRRYWEELKARDVQESIRLLRHHAAAGALTLVFGARDELRNNAVVLADYLVAETETRRNRSS